MNEKLSIAQLKNTCVDLKKHVIDMIYKAQSGHPGGSLSVAEFVTACYFREMNVNPAEPRWADRDRFVMSKGHVCPAQYARPRHARLLPHGSAGHPPQGGVPAPGPPRHEEVPRHRHLHRLSGPGPRLRRGQWPLRRSSIRRTTASSSPSATASATRAKSGRPAAPPTSTSATTLVVFVDYNNLQLDGTCDELCRP